jgi:ATP-dependent HslUV protease subunit HslV
VTTVVVVKKAGQVAIAADTLVTFGDTRLSHRYEANSKLFKVDTPYRPELGRHGGHRGALSPCCARP